MLKFTRIARQSSPSVKHCVRLFSLTIPSFSADTVTLVFIMSHGETATFGNDYLSSDLELITSDTFTSDEQNDAKGERQFSSILFASELMSWLERAPARSTILIFLDTCHAGAAASLSNSLRSTLQSQFGVRFLILASSLSQNNTYSALFTKELLDLWQQNTCLDEKALPHEIYNKMEGDVALQNSEGLPKYIVEYNGPLCLGNFGKDRHLLFMYAGQGAADHPYQYIVSEDAGGSLKKIKADQMDFAFLPMPLDAKKYVVSVRREGQFVGTWHVDLATAEHQTVWLDVPSNAQTVANVGEAMIEAAKKNGSSAGEVTNLTYSTAVVYRSAGRVGDALRMIETGQEYVASLNVNPLTVVSHGHAISGEAFEGQLDESTGDFQGAQKHFNEAARVEPNPAAKREFAKQAYASALASGEFDQAAKVRQSFDLGSIDSVLKSRQNWQR